MTLWNLIRDFFVEHIFGGTLSNGTRIVDNVVGTMPSYDLQGNWDDEIIANTFDVQLFKYESAGYTYYLTFGDWLSTTFTIITLILLIIFLYIFVKWIFKLFSGLLK